MKTLIVKSYEVYRHTVLAMVSVAIMLGGLLAPAPAMAVSLPFSPDCRQHQAVSVNPPDTNAILLTKQPVPHPNGNATVHDLINLDNYVIPADNNSCIVALPNVDANYCFIGRDDDTILTTGVGAIKNPGGLPACH